MASKVDTAPAQPAVDTVTLGRAVTNSPAVSGKPESHGSVKDTKFNSEVVKKADELDHVNDTAEEALAGRLSRISNSFAAMNSIVLGGIFGGSTISGLAYCTVAAFGLVPFMFVGLAPFILVSSVSGVILSLKGKGSLALDQEHMAAQQTIDHLIRGHNKIASVVDPSTREKMKDDLAKRARLILYGKTIDHE